MDSGGYSIVIDARLPESRVNDTLLFLHDGGYLSAVLTQTLTARMVTLNPEARTYGLWHAVFEWTSAGNIILTQQIHGLPALSYFSPGRPAAEGLSAFVFDLISALLSVFYAALTLRDLWISVRAQMHDKALLKFQSFNRPYGSFVRMADTAVSVADREEVSEKDTGIRYS